MLERVHTLVHAGLHPPSCSHTAGRVDQLEAQMGPGTGSHWLPFRLAGQGPRLGSERAGRPSVPGTARHLPAGPLVMTSVALVLGHITPGCFLSILLWRGIPASRRGLPGEERKEGG